ncbi:sigma-E processing peptidase SpoIIGA [Paenibacillus taiwanensis]|uniref:sigma-E processing peptidase SpoIIGA n=1 Tax=Paenibacillus taiwanensis TaxID=401638 RepID=UPI00041E63A9|nr:sigma-E processing peptidase SpoIIGA [Paenibacillus taiwanensis]
MTVIYADLVFGLNAVLDWTLLAMSARLRGLRPSTGRMASAAAIGTVYAAVLFVPTIPFLVTIGGKVLISICMLIVAFGFHQLGFFLRNLLAFYFSAFVIAGGAFGIQYMIKDATLWSSFGTTSAAAVHEQLKFGAGLLVFGLAASYAIYRIAWRQQKDQTQMNSFIAEVEIGIGDTIRTCQGLIDTGNSLKEPISGAPVMITNASLWEGVLPAEWLKAIQAGAVLDCFHTYDAECSSKGTCPIDEAKLRILPYRGVNQATQWMLGFKPDYIVVKHEGLSYRSRHVIVGLDSGRLSQDEQFQAIIHPELIAAALQQPEASVPVSTKAS